MPLDPSIPLGVRPPEPMANPLQVLEQVQNLRLRQADLAAQAQERQFNAQLLQQKVLEAHGRQLGVSLLKDAVTNPDFQTTDQFGQAIPDYDKIGQHLLTNGVPDTFVTSVVNSGKQMQESASALVKQRREYEQAKQNFFATGIHQAIVPPGTDAQGNATPGRLDLDKLIGATGTAVGNPALGITPEAATAYLQQNLPPDPAAQYNWALGQLTLADDKTRGDWGTQAKTEAETGKATAEAFKATQEGKLAATGKTLEEQLALARARGDTAEVTRILGAMTQAATAKQTPAQQALTRARTAQAGAAATKATLENQQLQSVFGPGGSPSVAPVPSGAPAATAGTPTPGATPAPVTAAPPAGTPTPGAAATPAATGRNEAYLATLPAATQNTVRMIADGRMALPSGRALTNPYWQGILQVVGKYDPSFDTVDYNARSKTRAAFTTGTQGQQVNALNTAIGHLQELTTAADALHNGNYPLYNSIANRLATATGWTGKTDFDTVAPRVVEEVTKLWRGSGGAEADISRDLQTINSSMAPQQIHSAIATTGRMMEDKLNSLASQYQAGMGTAPINMITPQARATLSALEGGKTGGTPAAAPAAASAGTSVSAPAAPARLGERRLIQGQLAIWDGKGWKPTGSAP